MAWYEKEWWKKLVGKKEESHKVDPVKDIKAITDFLRDVESDLKFLTPELKKLRELEKELVVDNKNLKETNLQTQGEILDKVLERYEFFQTDVDINGLRLKKIAAQFLRNARKAEMNQLVEEKKKDKRWQFLW